MLLDDVQAKLTGRECRMSTGNTNDGTERVTAYYMWLPLVLTACMGMCKLPRYELGHQYDDPFNIKNCWKVYLETRS